MNKIKKNKILVCLLIFIICSLTGCKGFRAYTINDYDLYVNFCESINTCNDDGILALFCDDIKNDKESELHIQREDEIGVLSSSLIEMKEEIDRQNEIKEEMKQEG